MIYTLGNIPQQHITKQYYTHHNNILVHNGMTAVIYGKSLIYNQCFFVTVHTSIFSRQI